MSSPSHLRTIGPPSKLDTRIDLAYRFLMTIKYGLIKNPGRTAMRLAFRRPAHVIFDNGCELRLKAGDLPLFRGMVELLYPHGVTFEGPHESHDGTSWRIDSEDRTVTLPSGVVLSLDSLLEPGILAETFLYDIHFRGADLTGLSVVDVGASIGDSALYFASKGATVYAYEPEPSTFQRLVHNLSLNPSLSKRVVPEMCAIGSEGEIAFRAGKGSLSGPFGTGGTQITVHSMNLASVLKRHSLSDPFLLKLDAKGSEFDIVTQPEAGRFRNISVEYSSDLRTGHDSSSIITALLGHGFQVTRRFRHNSSFFRLGSHGMIHATR